MRSLILFAATVGIALSACANPAPQVTTVNGVVEGFCITDTVNGFYGVPFAEPPARFAKPLPKNNWTGVLQTKTQPPGPIQQTADPNSEDALYLNVFAPVSGSGRSVLVFIYGGAYSFGSASSQGVPEHIAEHLVAKGIIVVLIQYRVGPLGFCTTNDSEMPGNYGMWDAAMSLQWIQANIAAFGGNPNDVTLYGGSAGAGMIEAMHLSPHTTNLFHKMVLFSGGAANIWDSPTKINCEARATSLGLTWTDSASLKSALLSANASDLAAGWFVIGESSFNSILTDWAPNIDGDFFPSSPSAMRSAASPKPIIWGISFLEGAAFTSAIDLTHSTLDSIVDYMVPAAVPNRSEYQSYFLDQYRNQAAILEPTAQDKHAAQAAFGERTFGAVTDQLIRRYFDLAGTNHTIYRYLFNYYNPAPISFLYPYISYASHAFDQWYSIGQPGFTMGTDDLTVVETYTNALVNFATTGDPNGSGALPLPVAWEAASPSNPSINYVIDVVPSMSYQFLQGRPHLQNILNRIGGTAIPV